jgi:hypothetical protein
LEGKTIIIDNAKEVMKDIGYLFRTPNNEVYKPLLDAILKSDNLHPKELELFK